MSDAVWHRFVFIWMIARGLAGCLLYRSDWRKDTYISVPIPIRREPLAGCLIWKTLLAFAVDMDILLYRELTGNGGEIQDIPLARLSCIGNEVYPDSKRIYAADSRWAGELVLVCERCLWKR